MNVSVLSSSSRIISLICSRSGSPVHLGTFAGVRGSGALSLSAFRSRRICMQAKLTLVPFDMPEAETELTGGAYVEYSGPPLAMFKLTRVMMLFIMPVFLVTVFWGGIRIDEGAIGLLLDLLKYVLLIVIIVLIRNTAPRIRIDQAVKFFWGPMTIIDLLAVTIALLGW